MDFKPVEKTIKDLLISGHQFVIPRFQRAYSWERKHYSEFLNDIVGNLVIEKGEIVSKQYFVGTMLFIGNFVDANRTEIKVVDGQQRLTTITILFSAIADIFKNHGEEQLARRLFNYIMTIDDDGDGVRILKSDSHYPYFAYFIQDYTKEDASIVAETEEEENIKATYDYFRGQLEEKKLKSILMSWNGKDSVDQLNYIDILKAIRDQVLACSFISISTDSKEQANRIFEILNAKGKRLDGVDLVKNLIFEVVDDQEPVDKAEDIWNEIRRKIEDPENGVGMATFYRHFWATRYKRSTANRLYDDFKAIIRPKSKASYRLFLRTMRQFADYYAIILNPSLTAFDNRQEYRWLIQSLNDLSNTFNIVQVRVPLMALLDAKKRGVIDHHLLKKAVYGLENFHFAFNVLTSDRSNKFEAIYSKFAIELCKSSNRENSRRIIEEDLLGKLTPLLPDYKLFHSEFIRLTYRKESVPSNLKTRYCLRKLNALFSQQEIVPNNITVEHILPEGTAQFATNIGNLILLERELNDEAGDKPYVEKKEIYKKSAFVWVRRFVDQYQSWDKDCFSARANALAQFYYIEILGGTIDAEEQSA